MNRIFTVIFCVLVTSLFGQSGQGSVITDTLSSVILRNNLIGLQTNRTVKIYLPPDYHSSGKKYAVIYYCHSLNSGAEQMFADGNLKKLLDRAISSHVIEGFILVLADYSTPTLGCWYENSSTSGNWLDFTTEELLPFIDNHFRTIRNRDSRGIAGDFIGGYGALKMALLYPELFSVVYALHPVGTGTGIVPAYTKADWKKIYEANSFQKLDNGYARPFVALCQAFLPNPSRPPFYCDFMVDLIQGEPVVNMANVRKWQRGFLLDQILLEKTENYQHMRGIGFDWARYDPNPDHVFANQAFTRKLDELGIDHEAEEYDGNPWNKNWGEYGRFYTRLIPFFLRHLVFEETSQIPQR